MSEPTPAQLRFYAQELRDLARTHTAQANQCEDLLSKAVKLCDTGTWEGNYPSEVNARIRAWANGLTDSAGQMRSEASGWVRAAQHAEDDAAKQPS